jgi:hypothetical protein
MIVTSDNESRAKEAASEIASASQTLHLLAMIRLARNRKRDCLSVRLPAKFLA